MKTTAHSECYVCGAHGDLLSRHYQRADTKAIYVLRFCQPCVNTVCKHDAPIQLAEPAPVQNPLPFGTGGGFPVPGSGGISW